MNGQFWDEDIQKLRVFTLACKEVHDRHTAANVKRWIVETIEDNNINPIQIFVISVDSAANITKGVKDLISAFNEKLSRLAEDTENEEYECTTQSIDSEIPEILQRDLEILSRTFIPDNIQAASKLVNCVVHKLQLAVNQFLWLESSDTTALINESAKLVAKLRTPIATLKLKADGFKQAVTQVATRWSSVFEMLKRLLDLKTFCQECINERGLETLAKDEFYWKKVKNLHEILSYPAELTKRLQAEDLQISEFIYFWISMMYKLTALEGTNLFASPLLKCLRTREKAIFENDVIIAGWYLDKSLSLLVEFRSDESKIETAKNIIKLVDSKRRHLAGLEEVDDEIIVEQMDVEPVNEVSSNPLDALLENLGKSSNNPLKTQSQTRKSSLDKDIEIYEKTSAPPTRKCTIEWWTENLNVFPVLGPIALAILCAPITEVSVERLFSHLNLILTKNRSQMKDSLIDDIVFLRLNEKFSQ